MVCQCSNNCYIADDKVQSSHHANFYTDISVTFRKSENLKIVLILPIIIIITDITENMKIVLILLMTFLWL